MTRKSCETIFVAIVALSACTAALAQSKISSESWERAKQLGVAIKDFPQPQGVGGFDEIPAVAEFKFVVSKRPRKGPTPRPSYDKRSVVKAISPDGVEYTAYCGRFDARTLWPGSGEASSNANTLQDYESHHGYGYNPADVFIGKREGGKIRTSLFFRDVGSHDTAPHHAVFDDRGNLHLIVSDVNISDNNELNVYALTGDVKSGKWLEAWLLDRRGFTSWSHPWSGRWGDTVHSLWNWGDATYDKNNANMGLFYVDWSMAGFGKKLRVIDGLVETYDAAIDPKTGRLLIVVAQEDGVFVASRGGDGKWAKPAPLDPLLAERYDVSVTASSGAFIVRTSREGNLEWVITPKS